MQISRSVCINLQGGAGLYLFEVVFPIYIDTNRRLLTSTDNDYSELIINLQKLRRIWARLLHILGLESADVQISGRFYSEVVQAILLFGA